MKTPGRILVIRNDKIGDFMLAWPAFSLLKKQFPHAEITALVPAYTAELAQYCESIDKVIIDFKHESVVKDIIRLSKIMKQGEYDLSLSLFSEFRTSIALYLARIKNRVGPATKIAQLFLNKKLKQKRSLSVKAEYEYNLDLVKFVAELTKQKSVSASAPPFLAFNNAEITLIRNNVCIKHRIDSNTKIIIIHPGTGGSAINLSLTQYSQLVLNIAKHINVYFIVTAGPGEDEIAKDLSFLIKDTDHHIHQSEDGILNFCKFINICDLFISGSTGPLHIAGALDLKTAAFYPARRSATPLRWQTINNENKRLSFSPERYTGQDDMQQINIQSTAKIIVKNL